ncbi:hypothetical protein NW765_007653 [Fusarium oxysporum]|nr:hypothetical protein NW765_007653 [Fusarium oxysporum]
MARKRCSVGPFRLARGTRLTTPVGLLIAQGAEPFHSIAAANGFMCCTEWNGYQLLARPRPLPISVLAMVIHQQTRWTLKDVSSMLLLFWSESTWEDDWFNS